MINTCMANHIYSIMTDEKFHEQKQELLEECKNTKMRILWEILFETDVQDKEILEDKIYQYGSSLKQQDYMGRDIFICLVAFLNLVIKEKTWYYDKDIEV